MTTQNIKHQISIITPFYNVEKYLDRCLDSLFSQTISSQIQYIFVDDASTDNSLDILKKTVNLHPNLHCHIIENKENKGLAYNRIIAEKYASGEYILNCDADDWMEPDMAETLLTKANEEDADIVACNFFINSADSQTEIKFNRKENIADINSIANDVNHYAVWNKLIRRSLIIDNDLFPLEGVDCWEDLAVVCRLYTITDKIAVVHRPLYHYRKDNNSSLTAQRHKKILSDHIIYTDFLNHWFSNRGVEFYSKYSQFLNKLKFSAKIKMLRGDSIEITRWKNTYPETNSHIFSCASQFSLTYRIAFKALALCPTSIALFIARNILGKKAE